MTPDRPQLQTAYLCFTAEHDEEAASRRFAEKYGQPPEYIIEHGGLLWLGPIVKADDVSSYSIKGIDKD